MTRTPFVSRIHHPTRFVAALVLAVLTAALLTACGQENDGTEASASLAERSPNDIPLNPPTLRFRVAPDGQVGASPERRAEAGEAVALVLDNDSDQDVKLLLLASDGSKVFALTAPAGERRDGRALPRTTGTHVVEVFPTGQRAEAREFSVDVSEN